MRRILMSLVLSAACLGTSGCYTVVMQAESNNPVLLNMPKSGGQYFSEERRVGFLVWGMIDLDPNAVPDMMRSYRVGHLRNVTISSQVDPLAAVCWLLTAGLYGQRVIKVEGMAD